MKQALINKDKEKNEKLKENEELNNKYYKLYNQLIVENSIKENELINYKTKLEYKEKENQKIMEKK